jgi:hypothetical protein
VLTDLPRAVDMMFLRTLKVVDIRSSSSPNKFHTAYAYLVNTVYCNSYKVAKLRTCVDILGGEAKFSGLTA